MNYAETFIIAKLLIILKILKKYLKIAFYSISLHGCAV